MRILSINLGDRRDIGALKETIEAADADIVCLQEVRWNNRLEPITKQLSGFHFFLVEGHDYRKDYGRGVFQTEELHEGLAVLSKHKFNARVQQLPIRVGIDRWPRIAIECTFENFTLVHAHLSKYPESRSDEFPFLRDFDVIVGDLNGTPNEIARAFPEFDISSAFHTEFTHPASQRTLDYVLAKKSIRFAKVFTLFSDHCPLLVDVEV